MCTLKSDKVTRLLCIARGVKADKCHIEFDRIRLHSELMSSARLRVHVASIFYTESCLFQCQLVLVLVFFGIVYVVTWLELHDLYMFSVLQSAVDCLFSEL